MHFSEAQGLEVTAVMGEPVIPGVDGLHLDGILAFGWYRSLDERTRARLPPITAPVAVDFKLPLAKWWVDFGERGKELTAADKRGRVWGWLATRQLDDWDARSRHEIRKKPALEAMARYTTAKSHSVGSGLMKAHDLVLPTAFRRELRWRALGCPDKIRELLQYVEHVGKKGSLGMGRVLSWKVEPCDVDEEFILAHRRVAEVGGSRLLGIRPPYHHASRLAPCS